MIFRKIAEWFSGTKKSDQPHPLDGPIRAAEEKAFAPYKTEPPAPPVVETKPVLSTEPVVVESKPVEVAVASAPTEPEKKPVKKPTTKKSPAKKPAAKKAPTKKPVVKKKVAETTTRASVKKSKVV
jgi:hypothetical protein